MNKQYFIAQFASILNLIRDHSYLLYSENGKDEYNLKILAAQGYFIDLITQNTGIRPPQPQGFLIPIDRINNPTINDAKRLIKITENTIRQNAQKMSKKHKEELEYHADVWHKVYEMIH